jgi:hypothetical protein
MPGVLAGCKKHPGEKFVDLMTRPGRNGISFAYRGCAKCKSERESGGMPPGPTPPKIPAKRPAKKSAPLPVKPIEQPAPALKGGGLFARAVRTLGLR